MLAVLAVHHREVERAEHAEGDGGDGKGGGLSAGALRAVWWACTRSRRIGQAAALVEAEATSGRWQEGELPEMVPWKELFRACTRQRQVSAPLAPAWRPPGVRLVSAWCPPGACLLPAWRPPGVRLVPAWCPPGVRLVSVCSWLGGAADPFCF